MDEHARDVTIALEGLEVRCRCGVTDEERREAQTLLVDVRLSPLQPTTTATTIWRRPSTTRPWPSWSPAPPASASTSCIERLATEVADRLWAAGDLRRLSVAVRKPSPPVGSAGDGRLRRGRLLAMTGDAAVARRAFVSLGSNLGDRAGRLAAAREALAALPGTSVVAASRVYETAPQDLTDQPSFLNQVVCLDTALEPLAAAAGLPARSRTPPAACAACALARARSMSIYCCSKVWSRDDPELTLPHPRLWQRAFVLVPLAEVWTYARGMPEFDVAAGAARLAPEQGVALYQAAEDE